MQMQPVAQRSGGRIGRIKAWLVGTRFMKWHLEAWWGLVAARVFLLRFIKKERGVGIKGISKRKI